MEWYSAKCVFRHLETDIRRQMYEERIILLKADSFDEAFSKAASEAEKYCTESDNCQYTGFADIFRLYEEKIGDKSEIFSVMRTSDLETDNYLERFYPEESENCESIGQTHKWFNRDNEIDACYHCAVIRKS